MAISMVTESKNSTKNQNIKDKMNTLCEGALDIPDFGCYSTIIGG